MIKPKRVNSFFSCLFIQIGMIAFLFMGCAEKQVNPDLLTVLPEDKTISKFPPDPEELIPSVYQALTLVSVKDETVTEPRLEALDSFIKNGFIKYSHVKNVNEQELKSKLISDTYHGFQPDNVAQAIQLGKDLKARYLVQLQLSILESKVENSIDRFKANINITVFTTDGGQNLFQKDIKYNSGDLKEATAELKKLIQSYFPLKGYILETRGGHQVAKLSIGRNVGVKLNREFLIRERKVDSTVMTGIVRKIVTYSPNAVAVGKVIKVLENECWISIPEPDRGKIKIGQVGFSQPEKETWY